MAESCSSCKFFAPKKVAGAINNKNFTEGWCRRYPPNPSFVSLRRANAEWCGEYQKGKAPAIGE